MYMLCFGISGHMHIVSSCTKKLGSRLNFSGSAGNGGSAFDVIGGGCPLTVPLDAGSHGPLVCKGPFLRFPSGHHYRYCFLYLSFSTP